MKAKICKNCKHFSNVAYKDHPNAKELDPGYLCNGACELIKDIERTYGTNDTDTCNSFTPSEK